MSLTILADVQLSESVVAAGVRGRNKRSNTRAVDGGGYPRVNINWRASLREFELGVVPMAVSEWALIEALFEATDGGAYGFLMRDPKDSSAAGTEGLLTPWSGSAAISGATIGLGWGVPTYRLHKRYTYGPRTVDRLITRPMGNTALYRAAGAVTLGIAPGNAALSSSTGTVTFVPDQTQAVASITVGATTVLTFANGTGIVAATAPGDRLYLTGVTGTAGVLLNDLSHAVLSVNAGAFTVTLNTLTTGAAVTASGTAARYPQPAQTLTWTGGFWTPVHFASDDLDWEILRSGAERTRIVAGPSVLLQEVRER